MTKSVTVLGLGPMGRAIAGAFLAAGHRTTVWNRTPSKATALASAGATLAATPAEAATGDVVVLCVIDYEAANAVLAAAGDSLLGRVVVNLTSGSPDAARETAAWAAARGTTYLDGAIMTPTETIGTPAAVLLHSGPEELYRDVADTLAALGGTQTHLGTDPGRAAAYDVALLDVFWTSVAGVVHAFALARSENIAATELAPLAKGIADLLPSVIDEHAAKLADNHFSGDYSNLASAAAGMAHIVHTSAARGIDASVMRAAHALTRRAIDDGHATDGIARLTERLNAAAAARG